MRPLQDVDSLGRRLRARRQEIGMTQTRLAVLVKISDNNISRYERDEMVPSKEKLKRIAATLKTTVKELRGGKKRPSELSRIIAILEAVPLHYLPPILKITEAAVDMYHYHRPMKQKW